MNIEVGTTFKNLTVISNGIKDENHHTYFMCKCVCGVTRKVRKDNLGKVTGCGCQRKTYCRRAKQIQEKPIKKPKTKTASARRKIENMLIDRELGLI